MLEALKKAFGDKPKEKLEQDAPKQEMQDDIQLAGETFAEQLNTALDMLAVNEETIAELNVNLSNMANEIEDYKQKLASLQSYADEAEAKAVAAAEEMKAKDIADKKQQLADVIGADNPGFDTTWNAVAELNAEAFNVVVNGFKASFIAEAKSEMFNEVGVSGEAEPVEDGESATMKILKQTYQNK